MPTPRPSRPQPDREPTKGFLQEFSLELRFLYSISSVSGRRFHHSPPGGIHNLLASERGVYAASMSLLRQLSLNSNLLGRITPKRPDRRRADPGCAGGFAEARAALFRLRLRLRRDRVVAKRRRRRAAKAEGRAPTKRQLLDAPGQAPRMAPIPTNDTIWQLLRRFFTLPVRLILCRQSMDA